MQKLKYYGLASKVATQSLTVTFKFISPPEKLKYFFLANHVSLYNLVSRLAPPELANNINSD